MAGERYERYSFNASEDDLIVSEILVNLEALIRNSNSTKPQPIITCSFNQCTDSYEPTWLNKSGNFCEPLWHNKRKRSVLDSPPSPPRVEIKNEGAKDENLTTGGEKEECLPYSPSSPLSYEAHNHKHHTDNIHLKHKSRKRKLKDWEDHIQELEQTKQQLKLSRDSVKKYYQTLLEFNTKLKNTRDEKNGELKRKNSLVNKGFDQLPIFVRQQQQECSTSKQSGGTGMPLGYYSVPFLQVKSEKNLQAAEARYRRKIKINAKKTKNSISLAIRNSTG